MSTPRILFSIPTRHHVEIALDEMEGMQQLGYPCSRFTYAAKEGVTSTPGRLLVIVQNAFKLIDIARKFKPDVIYFNSRLEQLAGIRDFITIRLVKTFYRKPVKFVVKSHGSDIEVFNLQSGLMKNYILPYLSKNVSGWLFLSSEEKNTIIHNGFLPAGRVFVTKNIVRTGQFKPQPSFKKSLNIANDHQVLLFVGRLIKEKGIYEVIEAFSKLKNKKAVLVIVGWGPEDSNLKQLTQQLGVGAKVLFTGFIPEQEVVSYYANSDVLIFPTYFPEGFPMALFNSVAAGLPIVTTPTRAATDYLSSPNNCLWAEAKNSDSVYAALQKLLDSPQLMANMKDNNLLKGALFSQKQVCAELAETLNLITA